MSHSDVHEWRLIKISVKLILTETLNNAFNWTFWRQILEGAVCFPFFFVFLLALRSDPELASFEAKKILNLQPGVAIKHSSVHPSLASHHNKQCWCISHFN